MKTFFFKVEIDAESDEIHASIAVPGHSGKRDVYVDLASHPSTKALVSGLLADIDERKDKAEQERCAVCTGACCTGATHTGIQVSKEDVEKLATHLDVLPAEVLADYVDQYETPDINGVIGKLKWEESESLITEDKTRCIFLGVDSEGVGRCSVYEARPVTCHEFSAMACEVLIPMSALVRDKTRRDKRWWE